MGEERRKRRPSPLPPDMDLWQRVAREVTPIKRDRIGGVVPEQEGSPTEPPEPAGGGARPASPKRQRVEIRGEELFRGGGAARPALAPGKPAKAALSHGSLADIDRRTAQRLQRGRLPIEATLDLHGMTQAAAHDALDGFVTRSLALGRRCVLIVTGKGLGREQSGVLRRQVPLWLNQPPLRGQVLAFDYARPEHGGMGALYVLLKRRREGP